MKNNWLTKFQMYGAICMVFSCDGCMAQDHRFELVGRIVGFDGDCAIVEIIKEANRDSRDYIMNRKIVPLVDTQKLSRGLYARFR